MSVARRNRWEEIINQGLSVSGNEGYVRAEREERIIYKSTGGT